MASALWQGNWRTRARIISGLVLFTYVLLHYLNIGLGLFSLELMERASDWRRVVSRSMVGTVLLYGALLTHLGLALYRLARRRTLRMPMTEMLQIALGLTIPFFLMAHLVHTRVAASAYDVNDRMGYIAGLIWNSTSGWNQAILLLVVWVHACIGLHMWLRVLPAWRRAQPVMVSLATLIPAFALAGFLVQGRIQYARLFSPDEGPGLVARYNMPSLPEFQTLIGLTTQGIAIFTALLGLTLAIFLGRKYLGTRKSLRIRYVDGPEIQGRRGMTLLEMSRVTGVPHMALCGGRGRCTTCRVVIEDGADNVPQPSPQETASLRAVNAPPNARLACQLRPTEPITVLRVFRTDGRRARAHESLGKERRLAILFLDMRGFTARTTGQLPYDVVFLLNRFFDAIVPAIRTSGGTVDKYLGDGLLAVFEDQDPETSARAGLQAVRGISEALAEFNTQLRKEGAPEVAIGVGLHLGTVVLGEIGARGAAPRTIIGDTVNTASRLEARTKELGVQALISEPVLRAAGVEAGELSLQSLELRGVAEPLRALLMKDGREVHDLLAETA